MLLELDPPRMRPADVQACLISQGWNPPWASRMAFHGPTVTIEPLVPGSGGAPNVPGVLLGIYFADPPPGRIIVGQDVFFSCPTVAHEEHHAVDDVQHNFGKYDEGVPTLVGIVPAAADVLRIYQDDPVHWNHRLRERTGNRTGAPSAYLRRWLPFEPRSENAVWYPLFVEGDRP